MKQLKTKHIWIIAKYHMRFSLRNGSGIIFLLLAIITSLLVSSAFIAPAEATANLAKSSLAGTDQEIKPSDFINEIGQSKYMITAVNWLVEEKDQGQYLLKEKPALLSCIMLVMLMLLPYLVCFGSFNQTSGDIANRGLRFLLLRTERSNLYLGRFLGTILFCLTTVIITILLLTLYIQLKLNIYPGTTTWLWSLQGAAAFFLICLPIIALCSLISCSIDTPFGSLVLCLLIVGLPSLLLNYAGNAIRVESLDKLWPTGWQFGTLNSNITTITITTTSLIAFTALFLWIGIKIFQKRDL